MSMTLLQMTQRVLGTLKNFGNVNNIADESHAITTSYIIGTIYEEILATKEWVFKERFLKLDTGGDSTKPTLMVMQEGIERILNLKYKVKTSDSTFQSCSMTELTPLQWNDLMLSRDPNLDTVDSIQTTYGGDFNILNDKDPEYYVILQNTNVWLDSYDQAVEANIQQTKTNVRAIYEKPFDRIDSFTFDVPSEVEKYIMYSAIAEQSREILRQNNARAERQADTLKKVIISKYSGMKDDTDYSWAI